MLRHLHLNRIIDFFSKRSLASIMAFSAVLLLLLGYIDFITGEYSLIVFYLLPVSLVAWFVGKPYGILFCILSFAMRLFIDNKLSSFIANNSIHHYWNNLVELLFLLIMSLLFSALRKTLDKEKELSSRDPLTGALNRRSFFDLADYELNRSRRNSLPFTIVYFDLDNFKEVNDRLGHRTGDDLLITVVATMRFCFRSTDILSRFGGDEFVVLLPETSGKAALMLLDKMHAHLNQAMLHNNWPVSFSIGAITYLQTPPTTDAALHQADELMYAVKHSGKNRLLHREIGGQSNG